MNSSSHFFGRRPKFLDFKPRSSEGHEPSSYFVHRRDLHADDVIMLNPYGMADDSLFSLSEYWRILQQYRWLIAGVATAALTAALLFTLTRTPLYTAEATLLIERQAPRVLKAQEDTQSAQPDYYAGGEFYKTQYELLRSRDLAALALRDSDIEAQWRVKHQKITARQGLIGKLWSDRNQAKDTAAPAGGAANDSDGGLIGSYLAMLTVTPVQGTSLVRVGFSSPDPELSARLANLHSAAYTRYGMEMRAKANQHALNFLQQKLLDLKDRVEKSEAVLNRYRKNKGIISLDDKENLVIDRLTDLNNRLTEAEAERIAVETQIHVMRKGDGESLPAIAGSAMVQGLKGELSRLQTEFSQLAKEFKPGYPRLDKVKAQIDSVQSQLAGAVNAEARRLEAAYQSARAKEQELRSRLAEQKQTTLELKDAGVQYAILGREVDTNRQLYDSVLQRFKEMSVAAEVRSSNVYVMEQANPPAGPSYPRQQRSLALGLLLGLAGGVGLAFLLDRLDQTLKTPEESEAYLNLPSLAVIPDFLRLNDRGGDLPQHLRRLLSRNREQSGYDTSKELILEHHPLSIIAESYRALRTSLLLSRAAERPRTLLFTSAIRDEGKTATAVNSAIMFAQMGLRTVLVDGDLRRPRCHKILSLEKDFGLTEVLTGHAALADVVRPTATEQCWFISSGSLPPNPAELLGSAKMREIVDQLSREFDCVIFDSPPVMPVTDAVLVAQAVDGVVLVVDSQKTAKNLVREVRGKLINFSAKILGVVLNRVDTQRAGYSQYYSHYTNYYSDEPRELRT
jgi:capsular exopolysaccharide synthesis family protein